MALIATIAIAQNILAHELKNTTARVELRDNHIRILIEAQVLDWLALLGGNSQTFDSSDIPTRLALARERLSNETRVQVDDEWAQIRVLDLPKEKDIIAMLEHFAWVQEQGKALPHGFGWTTLQLEAVITSRKPKTVNVIFPPSLGEMGITFSRPSTQWVQPAQGASFSVTLPPSKDAEPTVHMNGLAAKWAGVGALLLLFLVLSLGRKSATHKPHQD